MHAVMSRTRARARPALFYTCLGAAMVLAASGASGADEVALDTPAKGFSYSLGLQTGNNIVRQLPEAAGDIDLEAMMLGIRDRLSGKDSRLDVAELTFWSGKFLAMLEERNKAKAQDNLQAGIDFRAAYAKRDDVSATSGGVLYRELEAGDGRQPGIGQAVTMHVVGRLLNGKVFDDSRARGEAHEIKVRDLREGLQEAVTLMKAGSKWEVVVPPRLAYGEAGKGEVGPNETLVYEIELLRIE